MTTSLQHSITPALITYPARPVNGGRLEAAPPKIGPWIGQPKVKDWRGIVHAPTQRIWNRHGKEMSITKNLAAPLLILSAFNFDWLDVGVMERQNQLLRNSIIIFDWIPSVKFYAGINHEARRAELVKDFEILPAATFLKLLPESQRRDRVFLINEYDFDRHMSPQRAYARLQQMNRELGGDPTNATDMKNFYEGLVCKRTDKPYPVQLLSPTKETPWMIKHRFDQ